VSRAQAKGRPKAGPAAPRGTLNEARWEEILGIAAQVFLEKGYEAATVREIASRAGLLNQGSLYYYIESKEDLLLALIERAYVRAVAALEEGADVAGSDAPTRLSAFIVRWIDRMVLGDNPAAVVEREFRSIDPRRLASFRPMREACNAFVRGLIDQGVSEGHFDGGLDPNVAVQNIYFLLNNTHRWYRPTGRLTYDQMIEWYQTFVLRGLGYAPADTSGRGNAP
jgi:TetR/AcrR family transcriptional regulator, cholesterol catabolism regulator